MQSELGLKVNFYQKGVALPSAIKYQFSILVVRSAIQFTPH